jgi:hypothetical protein
MRIGSGELLGALRLAREGEGGVEPVTVEESAAAAASSLAVKLKVSTLATALFCT